MSESMHPESAGAVREGEIRQAYLNIISAGHLIYYFKSI
jgi:hypothetical protein